MPTSALRPRSATEIVDAAFQILKAHYGEFVVCSAVAYIPWVILQLFIIGEPDATDLPSFGATVTAFGAIWVTYAIMSSVIIVCASQAYLGDPVDVRAAVKRVLPRLHRIMGAAALRFIALVLGVFTLFAASIYFVAKYFALTSVIVLEDANIRTAFQRSTILSEKRKWHILNALGLVAIIYWALAAGVSVVSMLAHNFLVQTFIGAVFTILVYPIIAITEGLVYYDARIRSEGLDIELMANELMATPAESPRL